MEESKEKNKIESENKTSIEISVYILIILANSICE